MSTVAQRLCQLAKGLERDDVVRRNEGLSAEDAALLVTGSCAHGYCGRCDGEGSDEVTESVVAKLRELGGL